MLYVCQTAVDLLAESNKFPEEWLFKHRWGKGKKDAPTSLPNGEKIIFLTVGGRTSCVVPSIQKKTGPTADEKVSKKKPSRARKTAAKTHEASDVEESEQSDEPKPVRKAASRKRKAAAEVVMEEKDMGKVTLTANSKSKRRKTVPAEIKTEDEEIKSKSRARTKKTTTDEGETDGKEEKVKPKPASKRTQKVATVKDEPYAKFLDVKDDEPANGRRRSGRVSKQ